MKQRLFSLLILAPCLVASATAATTWNGTATDNITDPTKWSGGLLPTSGNQGTLGSNAAWITTSAPAEDLVGWDLLMTGGTLTDNSTGYTRNEIYGGTTIDVQGGTWNRTPAVRLHGGAELTVSGGTLNWGGIAAIAGAGGGFTLEVSDGTVNMANVINFNNQANNSYIKISGGTTTMGVTASDTRDIDEPNTFFTVSGGSLTMSSLNMSAADSNITMTLSGGGLLTTGTYNPNSSNGLTDQRYVNILTGTTGSWTLTGATKTTFEGFWNDNTLLFNGGGGSGGDDFDDSFQVVGNTLSLIPEPTSLGLALLTLAGLGVRRRR